MFPQLTGTEVGPCSSLTSSWQLEPLHLYLGPQLLIPPTLCALGPADIWFGIGPALVHTWHLTLFWSILDRAWVPTLAHRALCYPWVWVLPWEPFYIRKMLGTMEHEWPLRAEKNKEMVFPVKPPEGDTVLPTLLFSAQWHRWNSDLQNCKKIHLCCFKPFVVCGNLLEQP